MIVYYVMQHDSVDRIIIKPNELIIGMFLSELTLFQVNGI